MLLPIVSLFASFCVGVALGSPLASKHLAHKRAGSENVQEAQLECATCSEDIDTDGGVATLAFVQGSDSGITMCIYEESSGTEIICPYVTDTGILNGSVTYCPQTTALTNCVNS